ncbi:CBS domain containing membrane protein [Candidatus Koribacter versatilis Ellin345]|uniref:CBS domain containing membrane protein n=1 Tax=Koribacter versatilis (strain Ellin345) TaxID=204669 RepID=Q1IHC0_KORVE|nr:CBS domain-containing protein [Candidatus Koribacter versatilis]ABF43730.1 CBS domain containing membrane protein [Candidatus Koribacter versatilis Ellin345]
MSILKLCDQSPAFVSINASVADAITMMIDRHAGAVAVVEENHVVAGMFSERDVMRKFALSGRSAESTPVREYMSQYVVMGSPETTPAEALQVMIESRHRHLPIVDSDGKLLGVISIRHVLEAQVDLLTEQLRRSEEDRSASNTIQ